MSDTGDDRDQLIDAITREVLAALSGTGGDICMDCLGACAAHSSDKVRAVVASGATRITYQGDAEEVPRDLARFIDHTLLKPDATAAEIDRLCREAAEYRFAAVCINPTWVRRASSALSGSEVPRRVGRRLSLRRERPRDQGARGTPRHSGRRSRDRHGPQHRRAQERPV